MTRRSVLTPFGLCLLNTLLPCAALGQQNASQFPEIPTIKANVRQVLVPVVVTDKSGHYVSDLGRDDFSIFEDGVQQQIVAFSRSTPVPSADLFESPSGQATTTGAARNSIQNEDPKRTYLICLDNLHSAFENFAQVRTALKKFFATEQPGDSQYALVALGWNLHVIVDSTRDPAVILAAIDSKNLLKTIRDSEASNIAHETEQFQQNVSAWCGTCNCTASTQDLGPNPMCPVLKARVQSTIASFPDRMLILNQDFLQQLAKLVSATASMPTKRTVLFLSDGFNRFAGQELYAILQANNVGDPSLKFNPRDLQPQLDGILKLAVESNVRFYSIDSRGLYTHVAGTGQDASSAGASQAAASAEMSIAYLNSDAMAQLAKQTGGSFFENSNDLLKGIRRAFADGREEYVLAYVPSNTNMDAQFRKISVQLKDKKLRVAAKTGYWATP